MEGSVQHACSAERVDLDRSAGSAERVHDQILVEKESDSGEKEVPKWTMLFKSQTYASTGSANDSGFVEMCPPAESDDNDVWSIRRDYMLQNPSLTPAVFCSTPTTGSQFTGFSGETNSTKYQITPFAAGTYFIAHNGNQNLNYEQPKLIFNTVIENVLCNKIEPGTSVQKEQTERRLADHTPVESTEAEAAGRKPPSEFSRGHRTIASLLNSLPLNLVNVENGITEHAEKTETKGEVAPSKNTSNGIDITNYVTDITNVSGNDDTVEDAEITKGSTDKDKVIATYPKLGDSETVVGNTYGCNKGFTCNGKHRCVCTDIYDSQDTPEVDGNNNFRLVQQYSDISDACATETGTSTESSSSEEEQPEGSIINTKPLSKVKSRRKSEYPRRSAIKEDPRFKGVTVWLQTSFRKGQSKLQISAFYSNVKVVSPGRQSPAFQRRCSTPRCFHFSDQEGNSPAYLTKDNHVTVKTCASCKTRRTPLWRDADDGTPLCNACGIRYKKYRLRCSKCWHIPKKEVKTYPNCPVCGASLRYSFHKKTW